MSEISKKMQELVTFLNIKTAEYDMGEPSISDEEWDNVYFELKELEKQYPNEILDTSPTQQIFFSKIDILNKVTHNHAMLSLDKTKDIDTLTAFSDKYKNSIFMAKLDGLTISLKYQDGILLSAETRGNGIEGEDVTNNIKNNAISNIPQYIPYDGEVIVDGEVICKWDDFEQIHGDYKHPRNYAAGSIRLLDSDECKERKLSFIAWDCIRGMDLINLSDKLVELSMIGFDVVPFGILYNSSATENLIEELKEKSANLNYPIDGMVVKNDNCEEYKQEGETAHHPKAALAYKFYDEEVRSKLIDIEWSIGRTGVITPIAIFDPVEIDGTTVQRASLHNYSIMYKTLTKPYVGQEVFVVKKNMIIPQITRSLWNDEEWQINLHLNPPTVCPRCGAELELEEGGDDTINLVCHNSECDGQLLLTIVNYVSRGGLNIRGLSKETLSKLISYGWITKISDIYNLKQYREKWIEKAGWGPISVDKLLNAIEESKTCDLSKFIVAIGIPKIGDKFAVDICKRVKDYNEFRELIDKHYSFSEWETFGIARETELLKYDYSTADELAKILTITNSYSNNNLYTTEQTLRGLAFTVTGKLKTFKNREEFQKAVEEAGGTFNKVLAKTTNYLVNNDKSSVSDKNKKAKEKGIPIISEEQFLELKNKGTI